VIVLEYAVHGQAVHTGRTYDNHFVSVITIKDRKVTRWRDYRDPVAVFNAIGWPAQVKVTGVRVEPPNRNQAWRERARACRSMWVSIAARRLSRS
jgi:hypothetical protein